MSLFALKPARSQAAATPGNAKVVVDLDKLIAEPIAFKLAGKFHQIPPLKLKDFVQVYEAMANWERIVKQSKADGGLSENALAEGYHKVYSAVCPTLALQDVYDMTKEQRAALFALVVRTIGGEAHVLADELEKKNALTQTN